MQKKTDILEWHFPSTLKSKAFTIKCPKEASRLNYSVLIALFFGVHTHCTVEKPISKAVEEPEQSGTFFLAIQVCVLFIGELILVKMAVLCQNCKIFDESSRQ